MDDQKMWSQPARSGAATDSQIEAWWKDAVRTGGGYFDTHLLTSESVVQLILRLRDTQRDLDLANARVVVLREGLELVQNHPNAGDLYTGGCLIT